MFFFKAYDEKTEYFLWGIIFNREDIIKMIHSHLHIPIVKEMDNCHEIVMMFHETRRESIDFIKKMINKNTEIYGIDGLKDE